MTKDDVIRMAKEAGLVIDSNQSGSDDLERFYHHAVAHEQKRCIGIIYGHCGSDNVAQRTVDAIRRQS
jgi:hypothetical protein